MTGLPHTLRAALDLIADQSQRALDRVTSVGRRTIVRLSTRPPPPAHVQSRLEEVFDALADLPLQPNAAAALELVADALEAELPTAAMAAALHDIDADEMRFLMARGVGCELLRGTAMPVPECVVGHSAYDVLLTNGAPEGAPWIAPEGEDSQVMLCPILHEGRLLGMIALADPLCAAEFGDHDAELVRYVADQLSGFIHDLRLRPPEAPQLEQAREL